MKKLLIALAVLLSASVATDALGRRRNRDRNSCLTSRCEPCPPNDCAQTENLGGDSWVEYVECEIPRTVMDTGYKPVECSTTTICTKNPCGPCHSKVEFEAKYAGKIRGPYKGN